MALRKNVPTNSRDIYINPAGDNSWSGLSFETAVSDPYRGIDIVNSLSPPVSITDPASLNAAQTGTFTETLDLPDFTTVNMSSASFSVDDESPSVIAGSSQTATFGAILNFFDDGVCYRIKDQSRVRVFASAIVCGSSLFGGDGVIGFDVDGNCDDIFVNVTEGACESDDSLLISHTADSPTPITYDIQVCELTGDDTTFIKYNAPALDDITIVQAQSIADSVDSSPTGTMAYNVLSGTLVARGGYINCETAIYVADGAELDLDYTTVYGDIYVEAGGILNCNITNYPSGNIVALGEINGNIGGNRYGTYKESTEHFVSWHRRGNIPANWTTIGTVTIDSDTYKLDEFIGSFEKTTIFSRTVNFRLIDADSSDVYYEGDVTTSSTGLITVPSSVDVSFPSSGDIRLLAQVNRNGAGFGIQNAGAQLQFSET